MINDDIIVKYARERINLKPEFIDWVDYSRFLIEQFKKLLPGFPGMGMNDISIATDVIPGKRYIFWEDLDSNIVSGNAPLMGILDTDLLNLKIDAIGFGYDFERDPDRTVYRPGYTVPFNIRNYTMIIQVDTVPKINGGGMYYFYNKSPLDQRW